MKNEKKSNAWGIASLVLGIFSILSVFMPYFGLPFAIVAVVGAHKQNTVYSTGVAKAGNVLGILGIVFNSITLLFLLVGLMLIGMFATV